MRRRTPQTMKSGSPTVFNTRLIRSSVHSIAANYIPAIVARAVETGLWPAERALTVARRVASAEARAAMFIALLKDGHTDD